VTPTPYLVWVHLGAKKLPNYLKLSIHNFAELFSEQKLVLLVDKCQNLEFQGPPSLKIIKVDFINEQWRYLKERLQHDLTFRSEFWFNSIARFRAIYEFMRQESIEKIIHVESDVTFLPNFPFVKFQNLGGVLAYSVQSPGQAIASVMYVGSRKVMSEFLDFCVDEVKENRQSTDMTLLFDFYRKFPQKVLILPSLSSKHKFDQVKDFMRDNIKKESNTFDGVFDPISIGQFLFGIDPRNHRGKKYLYHEDESHFVKPSQFSFEWSGDALMAKNEEGANEIFSLHIHSKDKRAMLYESLRTELTDRNMGAKRGKTTEFEWKVFVESAWQSLVRRVGMK
jgi:hypothetical protein